MAVFVPRVGEREEHSRVEVDSATGCGEERYTPVVDFANVARGWRDGAFSCSVFAIETLAYVVR